ncbi:MAG TPA: NUDIX hydrolase [Xanthobacteraceae bacterium]|nr:NUDIX hydrolase [Xanthobacteraceae bacterium]
MDKIAIFPVTSLDLRFEPVAWAFARERRAEIDAHFAKAKADKPTLWNGHVLLMHRWSLAGTALHGAYMEVDFASLLAWRDFGFPDRTTFNCFGMAALRAADGAYLLGEMAPTTANAGHVYFPAGTPDPKDIADGKVDLAGNVLRELAEETGLSARDVDVAASWTCVRVGQRLAMMREMRASGNADDLRARILDHLPHDPHQELSDIHIVRGPADVDPQRMPPWVIEYFRHLWGRA